MSHTDPNLPPDLLDVARTLETDGPRMTEPEFARVRRTVLQRTSRPTVFTRSRLAITSMLAVGALMSTGGAALGVSALSTDLTARAAQYGTTTTQTQQTLVAPPIVTPPAASDVAPTGGSGEETTGAPGGTGPETAGAQAPRQLAAGEAAELPFTGYLAIPLLLLGLALLAAGLVLRGGVRSTPGQT